MIGLLAALGADAPELTSAVTAILSGRREVGLGVILGSNLFNLAALLGVSALVAGGVRIRRDPLLLDGAAGLAITLLAAALLPGAVPAAVPALPALAIFAGYALLLGRFHGVGRRFWPAAFEIAGDPQPEVEPEPRWVPVALVLPGVIGVLGGSVLMVRSALVLGAAWHLGPWLLGAVILAGLTSLPNLYVALHFARADRGTALVSAAMNSNTLNLLGGVFLPALLLGAGAQGSPLPDMAWLLLLTSVAIAVPAWRGRLTRSTGGLLVLGYAGFLATGLLTQT